MATHFQRAKSLTVIVPALHALSERVLLFDQKRSLSVATQNSFEGLGLRSYEQGVRRPQNCSASKAWPEADAGTKSKDSSPFDSLLFSGMKLNGTL